MPAFSLVCHPPQLTPGLHPTHDAPLPTHTTCERHGFGGALEPRYIIGAESLDQ